MKPMFKVSFLKEIIGVYLELGSNFCTSTDYAWLTLWGISKNPSLQWKMANTEPQYGGSKITEESLHVHNQTYTVCSQQKLEWYLFYAGFRLHSIKITWHDGSRQSMPHPRHLTTPQHRHERVRISFHQAWCIGGRQQWTGDKAVWIYDTNTPDFLIREHNAKKTYTYTCCIKWVIGVVSHIYWSSHNEKSWLCNCPIWHSDNRFRRRPHSQQFSWLQSFHCILKCTRL